MSKVVEPTYRVIYKICCLLKFTDKQTNYLSTIVSQLFGVYSVESQDKNFIFIVSKHLFESIVG